jgi:hypothetical protein
VTTAPKLNGPELLEQIIADSGPDKPPRFRHTDECDAVTPPARVTPAGRPEHTPECQDPKGWTLGCNCGGFKRYQEAVDAWVASGAADRWGRARHLETLRRDVALLVLSLAADIPRPRRNLPDDQWTELTAEVSTAIDDVLERHGRGRPLTGTLTPL